jgi:hypothetical protein
MTTKTKADPADELAAIEEQLEAAREERARLDAEARAWQAELGKLEHDLVDLARNDPGQFANGFPRPKTQAAKLQAEIEERKNGHKWPDLLGGADQRVRKLEAELSRTTAASADEPARREYLGNGKGAVEKLRQAAALIREGAAEYRASATRHVQIAYACPGLDGQDVWSDPAVDEAQAFAERLAQVQPPRSVSLCPLVDEGPPRVRSKSGGYIGANMSRRDAAEDQPQPVEPV